MKAISEDLRKLLENPPRVIRCEMCHGKGTLDGMKCGACGGVGIHRIEQAKGEA
jgi:DnaJ-class molecular chaperone